MGSTIQHARGVLAIRLATGRVREALQAVSDLRESLGAALAGRYRLERELGQGGMAVVFLAEDLKHPRRVAIKVLRPELTAQLGPERFLREIAIAARLQHPHILTLLDSGEARGLLYYVMPYAEGESLRQRLAREKQLPLDLAVRLTREVADALDYAHRQGLVHRDIKPENILLVDQHAVVADFGIARAIAAAGGERLTATGTAVGTPVYMSPEQAAAESDVDGRSDQYSLGCSLFEMLAGQPPFIGPTAESLAHQHLSVPPRPVTQLRPSVPPGIERAIARSLAKAPADRFATMARFAAELVSSGELAPVPAPAETSERTVEIPDRKPHKQSSGERRGRMVLLAAIGSAIVLAAIALVRPWPGKEPSPGAKAWILVAEFDGPAADSGVVAATRDLVMAALDQSEIVATVPSPQIRLALLSAGRPPSTRVDAELARQLAYRTAVRTVLEGRVGRLGSGYSLVLKVVDADSARSDAAADENALIPTVGRITRKLRAELGERKRALQATRSPLLATTPSFEACRAAIKGRERLQAADNRAAIAWARRALALDPGFRFPWMIIGYAFGNIDEPDSSFAAFREFQSRQDPVMAGTELFTAVAMSTLDEDIHATLALSDRQVELDSQSPDVYANRSAYLLTAGRYAEALECTRIAEQLSPFGASQITLYNRFWSLVWLGRLDEAQSLVPKLEGDLALEAPMHIAAAAGRWAVAESMAVAIGKAPDANDDVRQSAASMLAAIQASRGEVRAADQTLRQMQSVAGTSRVLSRANRARWHRLRLAIFSRGVAADPGSPGAWDSSTAGLVTHAVWVGAAGDSIQARHLLAMIRTRSLHDLARQGFLGPDMVEATLAARAGRWEDVLRYLGPAALQGEAPRYTSIDSAPLLRWLAAEAHEQLGRPDSAAAYFERAIAAPPAGGRDLAQVRMASAFGHQRLVLLYTRMGRLEEARRHRTLFAETFTRPDPELKRLVDEAQSALASAEAGRTSAIRYALAERRPGAFGKTSGHMRDSAGTAPEEHPSALVVPTRHDRRYSDRGPRHLPAHGGGPRAVP